MANWVRAKVEVTGPLADGSASVLLQQATGEAVHEIAQEGVNELQSWVMNKSGRATGFFQEHITTSTFKKYGQGEVIFASYPAILYGPWLEGTSRRNDDTRFKGYHLFRLTRQKLVSEVAPVVLKRKFDEYARIVGG